MKKDSQIILLESTMYIRILGPKGQWSQAILTSEKLIDMIMTLISEKFRNRSADGQMEVHMITSTVGARLEQMILDLLHFYKYEFTGKSCSERKE